MDSIVIDDIDDSIEHILDWHMHAGIFEISKSQIGGRTDSVIVCNNDDSHINDQLCLANSLEDLKTAMLSINTPLKDSALNFVFSDGNSNAEIVLLGEAPGAEEDQQGVPFVGQSGKLLDKILDAVGLSRNNVYITNVIPYRPPGNRTPDDKEICLFRPFVIRHLQLINPKIIVCLGAVASKALLQCTVSISKLRQKWHHIEGLDADILVTFHPAYLMRSPLQKKLAWNDFLMIKQNCVKVSC